MEKGNAETCVTVQEVQERIQEILSVVIVLETDMSVEVPDSVYSRVIKVIHRMLVEIQHTVGMLAKSA